MRHLEIRTNDSIVIISYTTTRTWIFTEGVYHGSSREAVGLTQAQSDLTTFADQTALIAGFDQLWDIPFSFYLFDFSLADVILSYRRGTAVFR